MADQDQSGWREKAGAFIATSSFKLREVASKASTSVAGVAGEAGSKVKSTWQHNVQPKVAEAASRAAVAAGDAGSRMRETWENTKESWNTKVLPRVEAGLETTARVAADTGSKLKQGLMDTTAKVKASNVGQRLSEMTSGGIERSKQLLSKVDWRHQNAPGSVPHDNRTVFGTPLEAFAGRQRGSQVPFVVIQCCNFILQHGLASEYIFESENDSEVVKGLMRRFDTDPNAEIPPDTHTLDVAQLLLVFLKCLPEPIMTHALYEGVTSAGGGDLLQLRRLLQQLPAVNLQTLHAVLCLLYRISQHADVNKMDAQSLAAEFAPVLIWPLPHMSRSPSEQPANEDSPPGKETQEGTDGGEGKGTGTGEPGSEGGKGEGEGGAPSLMSPASPPLGSTGTKGEEGQGGASIPVVQVNGEAPAPGLAEIPLEEEPTQEQTAVVEAIMVLIENHEEVFSHAPDGPLLVPIPSS